MSKILGIGTDIIEITRVTALIERHGEKFLDKLFTTNEINYCETFKEKAARYAGRFAAKEAIVKALGCGFGQNAGWKEIEILGDEKGRPHVTFKGKMKETFTGEILLSISHSDHYAAATALYQTK